jgi:hypothetical protein
MRHFVVKERVDALSIETSDVVLVLNKRLEKAHIALRDLELGLTLGALLEAIEEFKRLPKRRLKRLVVISVEEVVESGECLGSHLLVPSTAVAKTLGK